LPRFGPALSAALRATSLESARSKGGYDAIVIGSGATGGLAALLLTEAGLRVLVLDAGVPRLPIRTFSRRFIHGAGRWLFGAAAPRILDHVLNSSVGRSVMARRQPIQSKCYAWPLAPEQFVDDIDCPYIAPPDRPFIWLRSRQLGGRMVIPHHGRQYYRLAATDFAPTDGLSPVWPLRTGELDQWYELVEGRLALSGSSEDIPWLPGSRLSHVLEFTSTEEALKRSIIARWPNARVILGCTAPPLDSLEVAAWTGRLLVRRGAIARKIEVDNSGHVSGVVWIDHQSRTEIHSYAQLVFLCASALESTRLLLLSRSSRNPDGLGARSGALGQNLMDHIRVRASGLGASLLPEASTEVGRYLYLPRFDARALLAPSGRGFGVLFGQTSGTGEHSHFTATAFGEMLPRSQNRVMLDGDCRDAWGIPVLRIDCSHSNEDLVRGREQVKALRELAEAVGVTLSRIEQVPAPPGSTNHECGTARMGDTPSTSVLDPYNECWEAKGLYLTDGACWPSQSAQNPTLTLLALTARACDQAVRKMR